MAQSSAYSLQSPAYNIYDDYQPCVDIKDVIYRADNENGTIRVDWRLLMAEFVAARMADGSRPSDRGRNPGTGLRFEIARSREDVAEAWALLHDYLVKTQAIEPMGSGMYIAPRALSESTLVILAHLGEVPVGTMTAVADNPDGLPLEEAYGQEIRDLRQEGRKPMELCFFADRRGSITRSFFSVLEMTRYIFYFAQATQATDFVIASPLDHALFYLRYFSFERVKRDGGRVLHGKPTTLMRLRIPERLAQKPHPPEVDYFLEKPISSGEFEQRLRFSTEDRAFFIQK